MAKGTRDQSNDTGQRQGGGYDRPEGCLLRLFWMAFGNLGLLMFAMLIFQRRSFSAIDAGYWAVVAALVGARYADIACFDGRTTSGAPATMQHFRRYVLALLAVAAGLWGCVHLLRILV